MYFWGLVFTVNQVRQARGRQTLTHEKKFLIMTFLNDETNIKLFINQGR